MTPETKEALEKCIDKYDRGAKGGEIKLGKSGCALCALHMECIGCPIKEYTGKDDCFGTPYYDLIALKRSYDIGRYKSASAKMRDFLIEVRTKANND